MSEKIKNIIGVIGPTGAGKNTAAEYIAKKLKLPHFEISKKLKELAVQKNMIVSRANLSELGTQLAKDEGDDYLARLILPHVERTAVISGMRQLGQIAYLKDQTQFVLIAIEADAPKRFARTQSRFAVIEPSSFDDFVAFEQMENSPPHAGRLFECLKLADYTIQNNGTPDELYNKLDELLEKVDKRKLR